MIKIVIVALATLDTPGSSGDVLCESAHERSGKSRAEVGVWIQGL